MWKSATNADMTTLLLHLEDQKAVKKFLEEGSIAKKRSTLYCGNHICIIITPDNGLW